MSTPCPLSNASVISSIYSSNCVVQDFISYESMLTVREKVVISHMLNYFIPDDSF